MQYLCAIIESSEDAIYGKDLDGRIVSWNPAAERLFGFRAEEIVGQSNVQLFPLNRRGGMLEIQAGVRRGDSVAIQDTERLHKNGQIVPVSVIISPIKNANGEIIEASCIARDITGQKQAEFEHQQLVANLDIAAKQVTTLTSALQDLRRLQTHQR